MNTLQVLDVDKLSESDRFMYGLIHTIVGSNALIKSLAPLIKSMVSKTSDKCGLTRKHEPLAGEDRVVSAKNQDEIPRTPSLSGFDQNLELRANLAGSTRVGVMPNVCRVLDGHYIAKYRCQIMKL